MSDLIDGIFRPIYGKPCWQVQQGYGSDLVFEFGEPHLEIREPRQVSPTRSEKTKKIFARRMVTIRGDWHLWIYICDWRIFRMDQELANQDSSSRMIKKATDALNGQALTKVTVDPTLKTVFEFDLGGRLEVYSDQAEYKKVHDLWLLYEPSGLVFSLRSDGYYEHVLAEDSSVGECNRVFEE